MDALIPFIGFIAVCALLVTAAFWDVATMTIPNWLSLAVAALFPIAAIAAGLPWWVIAFNVGFGAAALLGADLGSAPAHVARGHIDDARAIAEVLHLAQQAAAPDLGIVGVEIGRASCRERVLPTV